MLNNKIFSENISSLVLFLYENLWGTVLLLLLFLQEILVFMGVNHKIKKKIILNTMLIKLSYGLLNYANFCMITLCQVRDPMPAVFFFLVDVSVNAVQTGATAAACSAISQSLADLPVSFFYSAVYLWTLN